MSIQWLSIRCCSSLLKNIRVFHKTCPQHRRLHIIYSKQCRSVLQNVRGNTVLLLRQCSTEQEKKTKTTVLYLAAMGVFMLGLTYASVPLYRLFCQATGRGGTAVKGHDTSKLATMTPVKDRQLTIRFNADKHAKMQWNFQPQQSEIKVVPGETALAFYKATNPTDKPIVGISTYNIIPFEAGLYFNKIQCFCFEEQRLNPHEEVDMPVFFYIDPEFMNDPAMQKVNTIVLSYTFFQAAEGLKLPYPGYAQ